MTKILNDTTYVAVGSNWWGSGPTIDAAVKRVAEEARGWGDMAPTEFSVTIYCHGPDEYLYWNERGTYLVDRETDVIKAYAIACNAAEGINPKKPLTTMRLKGRDGAYWKGAEAVALIQNWNEHGREPIGTKVN